MAAPVEDRAQPPIRWPHPNRSIVLTLALWALGLLVALLVPALIVPPNQQTATMAEAWTSFAFTVLGATFMMAATAWNYRKTQDSGMLILGLVPGAAVIVGGIILASTKLTGMS